MNPSTGFDTLWNSLEDFELPSVELPVCSFAQDFDRWAEELLIITQDPTIVGVNQAKVLLLDKYWEWQRWIPRSHRQRLGRLGHICIYQVFQRTYERLRRLELSLTPPLLFLPAPPPPPPQIGGIFLGEHDE